jgi:hypothetical protein
MPLSDRTQFKLGQYLFCRWQTGSVAIRKPDSRIADKTEFPALTASRMTHKTSKPHRTRVNSPVV